jgi:CheY-like chemotaxis protein
LILLDYMMPAMDGLDFAERVRARPEFRECVIIMLASAKPADAAIRCRQLDIVRWLQKPVKQSHLLNALMDVFEPMTTCMLPQEQVIAGRPPQVPVLRVLLAEDGLVNQQVALGFLHMRGHSVVVANTGTEALALLQQQPFFDVVLMDMHMPEMDGIEATMAIRSQEKATGRHVPIIALTASAMMEDRERCLAAGMDSYVSKPFTAQELFDAVEKRFFSAQPEKSNPQLDLEDSASVFDRDAALRRMRGRVDSLRKLAMAFLKECPLLMAEIRAAISGNEPQRFQRAAHTLKGAADVFVAKDAVQACWEVECMGKNGQIDQAEAAWKGFERKLQQLSAALQRLVDSSASTSGSDAAFGVSQREEQR